jgi:hypothetical protein
MILPIPPARAPWNIRTTPLHGATIVALTPETTPPSGPSILNSPAHPGIWSGDAAADPPTLLCLPPRTPSPPRARPSGAVDFVLLPASGGFDHLPRA